MKARVPSPPPGRRVALVSYSTKPRGGVVHTLSLAEAMHEQGVQVEVVALGSPAEGFFRRVKAPCAVVPAPDPLPTLEERVFASVDALASGLAGLAHRFDVLHTQDCIAARAAARVRDAGADVRVVRTVHHVDDFSTPALVDCQRQAILEPDQLVVVSEDWRDRIRADYGRDARVIHNGIDTGRFPPISPARQAALREELGLADRFVFLAVGGIEPRKGTVYALQALAAVGAEISPAPALVIIGGHSFQDYAEYREAALALLPDLGLELDRDVFLSGTVTDSALHTWYRSADALLFPSVKEGWGLVVLEAMAADLPVVASDIRVLREYLVHRENAVLTRVGDVQSLTEGMREVLTDRDLAARLVEGGRETASRFRWERAAGEHRMLYDELFSEGMPADADADRR